MPEKIAFLGPIGTYTDEACYRYAPDAARVPYASRGPVTAALDAGMVDAAVAPSEHPRAGPRAAHGRGWARGARRARPSARRFVNGFNHPRDFFGWFMFPDKAEAYLAEVSGAA